MSPCADPRGKIQRTLKRFVKVLKLEYACCIYVRNLIYKDSTYLYSMDPLHPYFSFGNISLKNTQEYCEVTPKTKFSIV